MKKKIKVLVCPLCGASMLKDYYEVELIVKEKYINVHNYPFFTCPFCGEQRLHRKATRSIMKNIKIKNMKEMSLVGLYPLSIN